MSGVWVFRVNAGIVLFHGLLCAALLMLTGETQSGVWFWTSLNGTCAALVLRELQQGQA